MKKIAFIFIALSAISIGVYAKGGSSGGSHSVSGYTTKNGTYVQPHHATNRDNTRANNWSQKGNVNPYTGKEGTKQ
jgi:hypothetical protein